MLVAVVDGPYDAAALSGILARAPVQLGNNSCRVDPNSACGHGTFVVGLLGARRDALIPGRCPECRLLHVPLFVDENTPSASVAGLAQAITVAVAAGARLINLSVAILGDDAIDHSELAAALDRAEESGAVIMVAAGNQGRLATGLLLSHPATVPVVAVDTVGNVLADCNFGAAISRYGVAALGDEVPGYAPGGGTTLMSGTSVATAIATGTLATLWSARPETTGAEIRAAIARLAPRNRSVPPMLDRDTFLAALDQSNAETVVASSRAASSRASYAGLQGETAMKDGNGPSTVDRSTGSAANSGRVVAPAHGVGGCACGAPGGICTCGESSASRFIYVLGSVDIRFPDQSVSEELQDVARMLARRPGGDRSLIEPGDKEPLRNWYCRVLLNREARYVARQLCWLLNVERQPAYYLTLRDLYDLDDLIRCLGRPEDDLDLVVGSSSLIVVDTCPGITAPVLAVEQLSAFHKTDLTKWVKPSPKALKPPSKGKATGASASDLFDKLVQSTDNFGDTDEWRALNYLAVNYQPLYEQYAVMAKNGWTLDSIKVMTSRLSREKHIVDPVFAFRQLDTGFVQKYYVRVDVSHLFPMMVRTISEYFDR
jgi:hypothetical protein